MNVDSLLKVEDKVRLTGNNGMYKYHKLSIPIQAESLMLEGLYCIPQNRRDYYFPVEHPKERIVLHFTAGNISADLDNLTRNSFHVSVPYVIGRDGIIYQLYPSRFWSGNIGKGLGNEGTSNAQDKCTIGIELSNYGYLTENNGNLETFYSRQKDNSGKIGPVDVYCKITDGTAYTKLTTPFRDQKYYASFTDEQYNSLIILLRYLTKEHNIPRQFFPEPTRYQTTKDVLAFKGIVSHVNYRAIGKWDIGPAFDWNRVIAGTQQDQYKSTKLFPQINTGSHSTEPITSEIQLKLMLPASKGFEIEGEVEEEEPNQINNAETLSPSTNKPRLYALLVGINNYPGAIKLDNTTISFPALQGCVNDSTKISEYLQTEQFFDLDIKILNNKEASKAAIVDQIIHHLGQATENDTAFFYFSGHGTQEHTDKKVFPEEHDVKLESLICYFEAGNNSGFLLSDKELRWLIHKIAANKAHIVIIFDCCHSGDNTRNIIPLNIAFPETVEKKVTFTFPKRNWESFVFGKEFTESELVEKGMSTLLPEGSHFQLSACESDESAIELNREGVFTKVLLSVLKGSGGYITYQSLAGRIRQYMRNVYEQKPKLYVATGSSSDHYKTFLNKPVTTTPSYLGEVSYNETTDWQLNLGAIHGMNNIKNEIQIFNVQDPLTHIKAKIGRIYIDYSEVIPEQELDEKLVYNTNIEGLQAKKLRILFDTKAGNLALREKLFDSIFNNKQNCISIEENEDNAQYVLRLLKGKYYFTRPYDPYRPLTLPAEELDESISSKLLSDISQISKWEFAKNLSNSNESTQLSPEAVKIEFAIGPMNNAFKILSGYEKLNINLVQNNANWENTIRIRLTNTTQKNLYCSMLCVMQNFSSYSKYLNPPVTLLIPNNPVELSFKGNGDIKIGLDNIAKFYNWEYSTDYFMLIASTENFDSTNLDFGPLHVAAIPTAGKRFRPGNKSAFNEYANDALDHEDLNKNRWITKTFELRTINPQYNNIPEAELSLMLNDENTVDFAIGLYFESNGDPENVSYRLHQNIQIKEEAEKGIVSLKLLEIANSRLQQNAPRLTI